MAKIKSSKTFFLLAFLLIFEEASTCSTRTSRSASKSQSVNRSWLHENTKFSRDNVGVVFNPFVLREGSRFTLDELIEHVSTKFSKLYVPMEGEAYQDSAHLNTDEADFRLKVPEIVARLNSNASGNSNISLEILMEFDEATAPEVGELAIEANEMFPGTVKQLIYDLRIDNEIIKLLYERVATRFDWSVVQNLRKSFGFGVKINMDVCNNRTSFQKLTDLHTYLFKNIITYDEPFNETLNMKRNMIYISSDDVIPEYSKLGVERAFPRLTAMFENCKRNIEEYLSIWNQSADVAFSTKWSVNGAVEFHELVQFVTFWERMNEWADKTRTTVVFSSAFDPSSLENLRDGSSARYGWWSLFENGTVSESWFEDKKQAAIRYTAKEIARDPHTSSGKLFVLVAVMILGILLTAILLMNWYLHRSRKSTFVTMEEVDEFFNGCDTNLLGGSAMNPNRPYNRAEKEISKRSFKIDEASPLGSGEFGIVYRGALRKDEKTQEIAVKTTKDTSTHVGLRGLMYEIKILAYLGKHPNVVELIGAYTANILRGRILLFLELCPLGSLLSYLRKYKPTELNDELEYPRDAQAEDGQLDESLVRDMFRWSGEIASGMEFIASKHVVHLDIAARNVLLTVEKRAKITDFGLSRRMYDYQTYIKTHQEPLPFRWMSPESLRISEFTEKSDVWSFGVLLWEIFTLGDEPYPGLSWDVNFPTKLEKGLRPEEPRYNQRDIYSVMLRCWATNPERRPTFSELKANPCLQSGSIPMDSVAKTVISSVDEDPKPLELIFPTSPSSINHRNKLAKNEKHQVPPIFNRFGLVWSSFCAITLVIMLSMSFWVITKDNKDTAGQVAKGNNTSVEITVNHEGNCHLLSRRIQMESFLGQKLFGEIDKQNAEAVKELALLGANLTERNNQGEALLHKAAGSDNKTFALEISKFLIEKGVDMEMKVKHNEIDTFLHRLVDDGSDVTTLTPQQFEDIAKFLCFRNQSRVFNSPGDFSKTPRNWYNWSTPFQRAIKNLEIKMTTLTLLQKSGVDFNAEDKHGESVLFYAIMGKRTPTLLSELVKLGSNWKHLNSDNSSLLHLAAAFGNLDQVKFFFNLGLDINAVNSNGDTPLHLAEYGLATGDAALLKIKFLQENGANSTIKNKQGLNPLDVAQRGRYRTLAEAIEARDAEAVEILVEAGADVNARNRRSESLLDRAALSKNNTFALRVIKVLIENKANVYATDHAGYTFLHRLLWGWTPLTASQVHEITSYLVFKNYTQLFSMSAKNNQMTPLLFTIQHMDIEKATLALLHKSGVNFNQYDYKGNSPLHYALKRNNKNPHLLSELVRLGADWRHRNLLDQSLLHSAAESKDVNGMKFLLNLGLDVNWQDDVMNTPLHKVVAWKKRNPLEMVKLLIARKADVNIRGKNDETPLDLAMKLRDDVVDKDKVIELLRAKASQEES